ncbi:MAG: murein biosynthesis integral membrane protein MurJ [Candidatus Yanofskybacteria bacterium CG10_big_fil_rev_8_21_14_0_10_36_16]|uniref:Probable lipid II flippase MurJ n=1 Tax=Candidatus Yanofskybacteria bacterium CG10_big_fil_rev_8_21_14_0_10_36_16 TaxID=1975096 RepID=A0A2J0QB31_9BACT|nr:MAG: murein biosynthesis integral membrane protein MurJ [Candidatus Yanofskybacteria bacterium CG10_big_fil_rev_8_21_14_0_10_36_16]
MSIGEKVGSNLLGGSIVLAVFSLVSRLTGLLRDRVLAGRFGASETLDIYYSAFKIPDFIFNLIIIGAVSSAFIPIFISYLEKNKTQGWKLASNFLNVSLLVIIGVSILLIIFVPVLMPLIAPGFSAEQTVEAIRLTRLMFLSPIIFAVSTIIGSVLQALKRFLAFALAPSFYNVGIIVGAIYFEPSMGLMGLGWGVIFGALLHLLVQAPAVWKAGFRWRAILDLADMGLRKILKLMIPRTLGLGVSQINLIVITAIASTIAVGSITIFNFANNIGFLPISMVGIAISVAVFPNLSVSIARNNKEQFRKDYLFAFNRIVFLAVPSAFALFIFRKPIADLILGTGKFDVGDVSLTAAVVGAFSVSVIFISLISLINRAFYAMHNTFVPVVISIFGVGLNIVLSFWFVYLFRNGEFSLFWQKAFGISDGSSVAVLGLALAWSISHAFYLFMLSYKFNKIGEIKDDTFAVFVKTFVVSFLASLFIYFVSISSNGLNFLGQVAILAINMALFAITFLLFAKIFKLEEIKFLGELFRKLFNRLNA